MNTPIVITFAESEDDLKQILELQKENHRDYISAETGDHYGFVTVRHNLDLLRKMNSSAKQIIAKDKDKVVGYALVMLSEFKEMIPVLDPMFNLFNNLSYKNKPLTEYSYYVMGQICVSKNYRGRGIVNALYKKHKEAYADRFELCLTEVSLRNIPSMRAHEKAGFEVIHRFEDETDDWNILLLNLRN